MPLIAAAPVTPTATPANKAAKAYTSPSNTQAAQAIYAPQQSALQSQQQNTLAQQALNGQQLGQQTKYANQQYGTNMQDLGLQGQGLAADAGYLNTTHGINVGNYQNDINYDNLQRQYAQQLFGQMMRGYGTQQGPHGTIAQQLSEALGKVNAQRGQAQSQYTDQTQQLGEQVGAQGAYGSRGAQERQGFLSATLQHTLGGLTQDQRQAQTQHTQQLSQLLQQIAQTQNQRQTSVSLANRRQVAAQYGIQQANADLTHGLAGNAVSQGRLGVQGDQYGDALQNAITNAGLNYNSGLSNSINSLNQLAPQQQQLFFNQLGAANTLNQANPPPQPAGLQPGQSYQGGSPSNYAPGFGGQPR